MSNNMHLKQRIREFHESLIEAIDQLEASNEHLEKENLSLSEEQLVHQHRILSIEKTVDDLREQLSNAEETIRRLEDEKAAFSRVSQIIAMEKENARLKTELEQLQGKLKQNDVVSKNICDVTTETTEYPTRNSESALSSLTTSEITPFLINDHGTTAYAEKRIKGTMYYVSQNNVLYEKKDDTSVGPRVGMLTKTKDGKTKVQWD